MSTPDPGAQSIPITSADADVQHDRAVSEKQAARARYLRSRGLSADPAPTPTPTPTPKTPRRKLMVKETNPQPSAVSRRMLSPAEAKKPGGETRGRPASAPVVPPGSDEVRMSRREFEAVVKLIDAQPWSKSGKRSTVGQPIQRKSK